LKKLIAGVLLATLVSTSAFGQQEVRKKPGGPRRQLATIVFAGLGGAILGLSTLSFYGRPQEHLGNIAIGFAVGIIAGTAYVTFATATTRDYYDDEKRRDVFNLPPLDEEREEITEPKWAVAPYMTRASADSSASYGAQFALSF
jgi:hypothetical protein